MSFDSRDAWLTSIKIEKKERGEKEMTKCSFCKGQGKVCMNNYSTVDAIYTPIKTTIGVICPKCNGTGTKETSK